MRAESFKHSLLSVDVDICVWMANVSICEAKYLGN